MPAKRKPQAGSSRAAATSAAAVAEAAVPAVRIGRILSGSKPDALLIDFAGNTAGPLRARTTLALDVAAVDRAVTLEQGATLVFENGDLRLPIVTGLLPPAAPASPLQELLVTPRGKAERSKGSLEAKLDGERVVLEGKREIVLQCGEASITLRRDGKILLRGVYVETYAKGVNRIKGGAVKIN